VELKMTPSTSTVAECGASSVSKSVAVALTDQS
jgi:hypothetical protein